MGIEKLLGGLLGGGKTPKVETTAVADTTEEENKAKKLRSALYATKGGTTGEEVATVSTSGRSTLYGN